MRQACLEFQRVLADLLAAPADSGALHANWREHLLLCEACRTLLERESAMEELLSSLPQPSSPKRLAQRVLPGVRARAARNPRKRDIEDLLGIVPEPGARHGLEARILEGLASYRRDPRVWRRRLRLAPALAALLFLAFLVSERVREEPAVDPYGADLEFLSLLPLLESWESLDPSDPDVYLGELGPVDWALVIEGGAGEPGRAFMNLEERGD